MREDVAKFIRTAQTYAPWLLDAKVNLQRQVRRALKVPFDRDFEALKFFQSAESRVFLDVGANRGQSIDAISMFVPNAVIHSFEPNPGLSDQLIKTHRKNPQVTVHQYGLSDVDGEFDLHVPYYRGFMFDGLASLELSEARDWLRDRIMGFKEELLEIKKVKCRTHRLDDLGLKPAFIKMDIQGHEFAALRGAAETLKQCSPVLLIEAPEADLKAFLYGLGYREFSYSDGKFVEDQEATVNRFFMKDATVTQLVHH